MGNSAVIEFRHPDWWRNKRACEKSGIVFCCVDAPELPREIETSNKKIYLRLHGREEWYNHLYSGKELEQIISSVKSLQREATQGSYIFLNTDHGMLPNGKFLLRGFEQSKQLHREKQLTISGSE